MELNESLAPFLHAKNDCGEGEFLHLPPIRIGCLTVCHEISLRMARSFRLPQAMLTTTPSIDSIKKTIEEKQCDVAIVDIERSDQWPGVTFQIFDEIAANFPTIILCSRHQDVVNLLWKAQYAHDIFPHSSLEDPRFFSLVYASALRSEVLRETGLGTEWNLSQQTNI